MKTVVHTCFQWILTLYGVLIKNPMGVVATILEILRMLLSLNAQFIQLSAVLIAIGDP